MKQNIQFLNLLIILLVKNALAVGNCSKYIKFFPSYKCKDNNILDEGSAGTIFLVTKNNKTYILKHQKQSSRSDAELKYLEKVKNLPYVIKMHEKKIIKKDVLTILDYGSKGSLFDVIQNEEDPFFKDQKDILVFFKKLVEGVQSIHKQNIVHADLKLENIVIDDQGDPMIIDFDLAVDKGSLSRGRGTQSYLAPEIHDAIFNQKKYLFTEKADVYSLGVILYAIETGYFPFALEDINYNPKEFLLNAPLEFDEGFSYDIMNIVLACLQIESKRATLDKLKDRIIETLLNPTNETLQQISEYKLIDMAATKINLSKETYDMEKDVVEIEHKYMRKENISKIEVMGLCLVILLIGNKLE